ncbi:MAG: motility protein A [Candidatus Melainabacteria bacterium]
MDKASVIGLGGGALVLAGALLLAQVPAAILLQPEALLMVFGGTLCATLVSFPGRILSATPDAFRKGLLQTAYNPLETSQELIQIAHFVRFEGPLPLQTMIAEVGQPVLRKGLSLIVDNSNEALVQHSLATEIEVIYRQAQEEARVFETAGGYAPTMGIIGAVIGLIHVIHDFHNPTLLGEGVAAAFSATLYGVALANLILLPMASRLRQQARDEYFINTLILEGILSIHRGEHPLLLEEKLNAFVSKKGYISPPGQHTAERKAIQREVSEADPLATLGY